MNADLEKVFELPVKVFHGEDGASGFGGDSHESRLPLVCPHPDDVVSV